MNIKQIIEDNKPKSIYIIAVLISLSFYLLIQFVTYLNRDKTPELQKEQIEYASDMILEMKRLWKEADEREQMEKNNKKLYNKEQERYSKCIEQNSQTGVVVNCETFSIISKANAEEIKTHSTDYKPNPVKLKPSELFYTTAVYDKCHVSQTEEQHFQKKNGGMMATDIACRFGKDKAQRATVFAPDYVGEEYEYQVNKVGNDKLLGNYVELWFCPNQKPSDSICFSASKWIIAHIETKLKEGDIVHTGQIIGQMDISGATTGYHTHIELWKYIGKEWTNISYSTRSKALDNRRSGKLDDTVKKGDPIYSTQYNLGDVNQNDSSPFIGASGKDLRHVDNPIALTVDIRNLYGIKFGYKVKLEGPCPGIYQVEDEMNIRYRTSCIQKEGGCIKMDIAIKPTDKKNCSGIYTINKI